MRNEKFKNQIKKNKAAVNSSEGIAEALYEEEKNEEPIVYSEPSRPARKSVGRPRGEDTIQKTIYIPRYLWSFVQAAVKVNGGNLQSYLSGLIEADINKNRDKYKDLADIFKTIDGGNY